jgi:hypothetical protein
MASKASKLAELAELSLITAKPPNQATQRLGGSGWTVGLGGFAADK